MNKKAIKFIDNLNVEDVKGKTILITGGNSGIGFVSAIYALYLKMNVIIACRNKARGEEAINKLKEEFKDASIRLMILDTSEEESIKQFVSNIKKEKIDIDIFYHNAGIFRAPYELKENKELIASTNYYGPYMLTSLLLDYFYQLKHEVKVIYTSSIAAKRANNNVDILRPTSNDSSNLRYCNSKLLDAYLFSYMFNNDKNNIKYYLVHPGVTATALFAKTYHNRLLVAFINGFIKLFGNPLWKSALSFLLTISKDNKPGAFYGPTKFFNVLGYPKENHFLDNSYIYKNEIIALTSKITSYKLDIISKK